MNNYCSQKFWWLSVEPERRQVQSCCSAYPHKIDLAWVKNNSGNLFNIPVLQKDRKDMLNEIQVKSCEGSCWAPERQGKPSRRTIMKTYIKTHDSIVSKPEVLHVNLGSDCNLTCVYCSKQYSTSWLRDISDNGPYDINESRYKINSNDRILLRLGQKEINNTQSYNLIIQEMAKYTECTNVYITGGEPFLNNSLVDLVKNFTQKIKIYTGLGVGTARLEKILSQLPGHVEFGVSAESIGNEYEFIRYNNTFDQFEQNLKILLSDYQVTFSSTISNLTIPFFKKFEEYYPNLPIELSFCNEPDYLSVNVLDATSKDIIRNLNFRTDDENIKLMLNQEYTESQKKHLVIFIKEFVKRRNLDLKIFPTHFLNWLNTPQ